MSKIKHQAVVAYSSQQMYDLVNDVAAYPQFLPWCAASEILSQTSNEMTATITIKKGIVEQTFTTKNDLVTSQSIIMNLINGPFRFMRGEWKFDKLTATECTISFSLEYEFNNRLLAFTLESIFSNIANTMIDAFEKRAAQVYGSHD